MARAARDRQPVKQLPPLPAAAVWDEPAPYRDGKPAGRLGRRGRKGRKGSMGSNSSSNARRASDRTKEKIKDKKDKMIPLSVLI